MELGSTVVDTITGFSGVVTGRAEYLTGCVQYCVQPVMEKGKNKVPEANWFDEGRLETIDNAPKYAMVQAAPDGGPQANEAPKK